MLKKLLFLAAFATLAPFASSQEAPATEEDNEIAPDRPGFGDAVGVVNPKKFQFEAGVQYDIDKPLQGVRNQTFTWTNMLLRLGVMQNVEARLDFNILQSQSFINDNKVSNEFGLAPFRIGMKAKFLEAKGARPAMTFIGMFGLPYTATKAFRPNYTSLDLQLSFAHPIAEWLTFCYNIGSAWDGNTPNPQNYYAASFEFRVSPKWGGYIQERGFVQRTVNVAGKYDVFNSNGAEAGIMFYPKPNMQVDLSGKLTFHNGSLGITPAFVTLGFSWLFI